MIEITFHPLSENPATELLALLTDGYGTRGWSASASSLPANWHAGQRFLKFRLSGS